MSQEFYLLDDEEAFQFSTSMDQREAKRMLRKHAPHLFSEKASVCQPPAPVQVSEDEVKAIVAKAMEEAWSDFCVDANAYPPDITNRRGRISFSPHTWADWTGALVYRALEAALQAGVPRGIDNRIAPIFAELERATKKFPTWPTDPLHAFAVVGEEFGECQKEVLQLVYEPHKSSPEEVRKEAIQMAAMALRFVMSLDVYIYTAREQHSQQQIAAAPAPGEGR
jgi:hypothetical protein